ncbi:MAG: hypothetical protein AAF845_15275 [Bacteroidota bacterium]
MSKLAFVALLPLLAVGALLLAILSLWSVERAPSAVRSAPRRAAGLQPVRGLSVAPVLARAA